MIWGGISVNFGKLPLYIHENKNKINADVYIEILENYVKLLTNLSFLVQDGATSHTAKRTIAACANLGLRC